MGNQNPLLNSPRSRLIRIIVTNTWKIFRLRLIFHTLMVTYKLKTFLIGW
ncbi:unnamed protein product [Prunus brigantina]